MQLPWGWGMGGLFQVGLSAIERTLPLPDLRIMKSTSSEVCYKRVAELLVEQYLLPGRRESE